MATLYPWSSLAAVERFIADEGDEAMRAWAREHWNPEFLDAEPAVVKRLLPYVDLARCDCRAATILYAVDHDWVWVLDAADAAPCGFLPAFWRDAFERAQQAGSTRCIAWLLDAKGVLVGTRRAGGLEL